MKIKLSKTKLNKACLAAHIRTQKELASLAEVPYSRVNDYIHGRRAPTREHLFAFAELLQVDIKSLVTRDSEIPTKWQPFKKKSELPPEIFDLLCAAQSVVSMLEIFRIQQGYKPEMKLPTAIIHASVEALIRPLANLSQSLSAAETNRMRSRAEAWTNRLLEAK